MLLPCFQPSQCNIDCPVISSKSMWNSKWQPHYNVDFFRFVGRHLELLVMSYHRQCWGMLLWSVLSSELLKTAREYEAYSCVCTWFCKWTRFWQNFNRVSGFPASILNFRCNTGQYFSRCFVAQPLLGNVTKPFHFIPNGSEMPLKRLIWG